MNASRGLRRKASPAQDAPWWAAALRREPARSGVRRSAQYIKVRDGTLIAIDLFLPADLGPDERIPTLMMQTPYFRAVEFRHRLARRIASKLAFLGNEDFAERCVAFGYAFILMDLRGSGASHGKKRTEAMRDGAADGSDVIDWVTAQPWSNGRVGATGVSGHGLCAVWQTTARNPALGAIAPRFTAFDNFTATHPGGAVATRFMRDIGALVTAMDRNQLWRMPDQTLAKAVMWSLVRGIKPVDEDADRSLLAQAVGEHRSNVNPADQMVSAEFRDDAMAQAAGATMDQGSLFAIGGEIRDAQVPVYVVAGWMDAGFARELINFFNTVCIHIPGSKLTIGPWAHGGKFFSSPTAAGKTPTAFDQAAELTRFFDWHLRGVPAADEAPVHYFTMGEERWRSAASWPPPAVMRPFYLAAGHELDASGPGDVAGGDRSPVDFTHGTGVHSRFGKHLTSELFPVTYPDRARRDRRLVVYDTPPLGADTEVTGHPQVDLFVSSTADDGLFIAYLEDVAPDGSVRTVADGWLRARHRRLSDEQPPYWLPGPYRTYTRDDAAPLVPHEVTELRFDLYPTSWLFRRGHRIRVAIAGADKDNLQEVAREQSPVITVHYGPAHPSRVELPVVEQGATPGP